MQDSEFNPESLETLLHDVAANQHSLHVALTDIYEKLDSLETKLDAVTNRSAHADNHATAVDLYDEAYALAQTGSHISVPYLARKLATSEQIAHELLEQLRSEGVVNAAAATSDEDEEVEVGDVFTTIDLKDATTSATPLYSEVKEAVVREQSCSAAWLKRKFAVNDEVAKQWLAQLETDNIIASAVGKKPREVLVTELDDD